jgi:hypothetical protein
MKRTLGLVAMLAAVAPAHAFVLIDDFNTGSLLVDSKVDFYGTEVIGGTVRYGATDINSNAQNRFSTFQVAGGRLFVENDSGIDANVVYGRFGAILNGAPTSGPGGLSTSDVGSFATALDLSGESAFRIDFTASDQSNAMIGVFVYDKTGATVTDFNGGSMFAIPQGGGSVIIPFSDVFSTVPLNNVGAIGFVLELPTGNDVAITEFAAVPEPASLAALGLGALALVRRRRAK